MQQSDQSSKKWGIPGGPFNFSLFAIEIMQIPPSIYIQIFGFT